MLSMYSFSWQHLHSTEEDYGHKVMKERVVWRIFIEDVL